MTPFPLKQTIVVATALLISLPMLRAAADAAESEQWQIETLDSCKTVDNVADIGTSWTATTDSARGGTSSIEWFSTEGTFGAEGTVEAVPGSMGPGTAGLFLPLGEDGTTFDLTSWDGISITIRHEGAPLLLRVHCQEIENEDQFSVVIPENSRLEDHRFSFRELGQVMSAQQPWKGTQVTGIELVCFGWVTTDFKWEISELSFYSDDSESILEEAPANAS